MSYQSLVAFEGWTFIAQILNLFIQMYLFKKFLFKPIQNILAQRQQEVDNIYADADSAKKDAESAKAEYEGHLLTARTEAEEITARAVKNAQTRSDAMLASAQSEAAAMREKGRRIRRFLTRARTGTCFAMRRRTARTMESSTHPRRRSRTGCDVFLT